MRLAVRERWPLRELQQQLAGALFERTVVSPAKLSAPPRELHAGAEEVFKDACLKERLLAELHVVGGDVQGIHPPCTARIERQLVVVSEDGKLSSDQHVGFVEFMHNVMRREALLGLHRIGLQTIPPRKAG
jgi:hypothetical protein